MINFLLLMLIPIAVAIGSLLYFKHKITFGEFALQLAGPAILVLLGLGIAYYQSTTDREIWNGRVTAKEQKKVSCSHSYKCFCYDSCTTDSKGNRSCTEICQTCYEHDYDFSWYVYASTGESLTISRVDRQGVKMPPRWGSAFIGEPFSSSHSYENYILANPDSVLLGGKGDVEKFKHIIPDYAQVYDYYRANHAINMSTSVSPQEAAIWEWLMDEINGDLGPKKQVNVTLLIVPTNDPKYMLALKDAWVGGKKNDAVVVIGVSSTNTIFFADVLTWSPSAMYKVALRDRITKIGTLAKRDDIAKAIREETDTKFVRMQMKDYQYLMRSFQPSSGAMIFLFILGILMSGGLAYWSVINEFEKESTVSRYRRPGRPSGLYNRY